MSVDTETLLNAVRSTYVTFGRILDGAVGVTPDCLREEAAGLEEAAKLAEDTATRTREQDGAEDAA